MQTFYQIVTRSEVNGNWFEDFIENSEIYQTYEDAYQKALDLALKQTQGFYNDHLEIKHHTENNNIIIKIVNRKSNDIKKEYHIKKLKVV